MRDIPVYKGWIEDQVQAYKVHNLEEYKNQLMHIFENNQEQLLKNARELAENRSIKAAGERLKVVYRLADTFVVKSSHRKFFYRSVRKRKYNL